MLLQYNINDLLASKYGLQIHVTNHYSNIVCVCAIESIKSINEIIEFSSWIVSAP